jgi:DNA-binding PadR family transcriptional regulator
MNIANMNIRKENIIMSLRHGLLGLVNYEPLTGYELTKEFERSLGFFWHTNFQQIYKALDTMEKDGWLISENITQTGKPNKRVYSITPHGKSELLDWLSSPEPDIKKFMQSKNVFLMRLAFMGETTDEQGLNLLHTFKKEYISNSQKFNDVEKVMEEAEGNLSPKVLKYWKLVALHGEIIRKARLEFVDKAIEILETGEWENEED